MLERSEAKVVHKIKGINPSLMFYVYRYQVMGTQGPARYGMLELPHGRVETPVFMPGSFLAFGRYFTLFSWNTRIDEGTFTRTTY